ADTTIIIRNNRILEIIDKETTLSDAFALCNNVLINAVRGISEPILKPGIINLDFADVKTIMAEAGPAVMGIGQANGDERAIEAAKKAVSFPLLNISIDGAKGILFSVASRKPLTLSEVNEVAKIITASADPDAKIIFGVIRDESLKKGELKVTVVATGFSGQGSEVIPKRKDK
ncbi:MAG: cell division protein FtsZ, partial [Patescibacteria group bacterium]